MRRSGRVAEVILVALGCYTTLLASALAAAEQPLSKEDILSLLRSGSSSENIIAVVEQRKVNFRMDPDIAKEFHDAGASDELIEALQKVGGSVISAPPAVLRTVPETSPTAPNPPPVATSAASAAPTPAVPAADPAGTVLLPAGTTLSLELQDSLNSHYTKKGDSAEFKVSPAVQVGDRVVIPQDTGVEATVVRAKRAGMGLKKGELQLEFNKIVLANGASLPLAAKLVRAGQWNRSSKLTAEGDRNLSQDLQGVAGWALIGTLVGGSAGDSGKAAAIGAGAGAAVGVLAILLQRGPELELPPGMMFQVELTQPLKIPVASSDATQLASNSPPSPPSPTAAPPVPGSTPSSGTPVPPSDASAPANAEPVPLPAAAVAAGSTTPPSPVPAPPVGAAPAGPEPTFKIKVDVDLVMVEATVRDERGVIYIKLKREDFRVLEDGVEQQVRHFSRDELPLAVALVIDRSGSVAPVMDRLRRAANETLSQLKSGDLVALFAFAETPELIQELTTNRQVIANGIAKIRAGGGTNIKDALFEAAAYLAREAPARRRAIILISDNQETVSSRVDESQVVRTALEAESVVYSIKVEDRSPLGVLAQPIPMPSGGAVKKITQETGGEIFETRKVGSVESAMQAVISRLKLRFTLGYQSTNTQHHGGYRRIDVRLTDKQALARGFTVYARRGYYAPKSGSEAFPPPVPENLQAPGILPSNSQPAAAAEPAKLPSKPFTNDDVLKLVKGGFGEETILEAIRTNECRFDTSAEALLGLKNAGVDEKIIKAMLAAKRAP